MSKNENGRITPDPYESENPPPSAPVESPGEYFEFGEEDSEAQTIDLAERKDSNSSTRKG